ncbi:Alkanal monooxygenase alpha chain [Nocardia otitidiscaviarum]|uniref:Alkanal monooxygenase alpha chain n=1 Tax=Nocardia otitidiscaviarum TaxID=1823 RepID=A0A379JLD3_9NOCA|nr:LLM class flavin-dependent oxidoreductase [Nocardia otitidiscaviarum]SUD49328.1 Alkanal monooxygenase alpha chain [Nocardia otitidiscaviarum]
MPFALSILDLATIARGQSARDSFDNSVALARAAERSGYRRVWYAEHHNMKSIASSATSVLIGHVASKTETIRVGAGGIMLPNHSPLVIAEQFGTLETLYPGRIDLGLGRAPGSDQTTMRALRRDHSSADSFPQDVLELQGYLSGDSRIPGVQAVPRAEGIVPLYILGSSLFGAQLAAHLGLPYAFASHFAPDALHQAVTVYRDTFRPSEQQPEPYVMAGVNVFAAEDHDAAVEQQTIAYRARTRAMIKRGAAGHDFTDAEIDAFLTSPNGRHLAAMTQYTAVGTPAEVQSYLEEFATDIQADELILAHHATEIEDRIRSVELTGRTNAESPAAVTSS